MGASSKKKGPSGGKAVTQRPPTPPAMPNPPAVPPANHPPAPTPPTFGIPALDSSIPLQSLFSPNPNATQITPLGETPGATKAFDWSIVSAGAAVLVVILMLISKR